jgi:putative redox protein
VAGDDNRRSVRLERIGASRFRATNVRGGTLEVGGGDPDDRTFTPVELLMVAMAGCSGIDVDILTSRRSEPTRFEIGVEAEKVRDERGNHLDDIVVTFAVSFPEGAAGDAAREVLPDAVRRSHERLCTVTRTVALPTHVTAVIRD